jgi:hypothetical protein
MNLTYNEYWLYRLLLEVLDIETCEQPVKNVESDILIDWHNKLNGAMNDKTMEDALIFYWQAVVEFIIIDELIERGKYKESDYYDSE